MINKVYLLFCVSFLIAIPALSQRFQEPVAIKETFFTPDGKSMYLTSEKEKVYRWNIDEGTLEKEWSIPSRFTKMYFVGEDVYLHSEIITESYDAIKTLYKWNPSTDDFELYYNIKPAYYDDNDRYVYETLESVGSDGSIVTFLRTGSAKNTASTFGPLFLINPKTESKKEIIKLAESGAVFSEPFFQPSFDKKLICMDFTKFDYAKKKVNLYDVSTGKHTTLRKKVKYNNSVLHGFQDVFVFEYYSLQTKKSEYTFYDANGEQIALYGFGNYCGILFDQMKNEIYLRQQDGIKIDVYSVLDKKIVRTVPAFEDFFLRSENREPIQTIENGKHHRFVNESVYMKELIGYVEEFSFETGTYMRVGQPLREGYSFKERDELYVSALEKKAKSAKAAQEKSAKEFETSLAALPMATNSGNTMNLRKQGTTIQNDVYPLVSIGCYGQLAEHAVKLAQCDSRVVMLIQSDETSSKMEGDYKIDIVAKNYYLSIVNSNSKYEKITLIGQDIHETHTNKHTMKVEKSGWHSTPVNFNWTINDETITVSSPKGTFHIDAQSCTGK